MSNKYRDYVKSSERKVILKLIGISLLILAFVMVQVVWSIDNIIMVPIIIVAFVLIMYIATRKNKKAAIKYKLRSDIFTIVRYPLYDSRDYLSKLTYVLNNELKLPEQFNSLIDYIEFMIDNKQMIFLPPKFKINDAVNMLNEILAQYNVKLDANDILQRDTEVIKERRKNNIQTECNDLSIIRVLLQKDNLELVSFYNNLGNISKLASIGGYLLAVIPISKMDDVIKILH